jgi:Spy/CpxP family protein refolding chaperone
VLAAVAVAAAHTAVTIPAAAQERKADDAFARALFDPQLVLRHARDIDLTPAQRRTLLEELKRAQTDLAPLQVDMTGPSLELIELLEQPQVDEEVVRAKTIELLRIENQVKVRQIGLLVRIKNLLTRDQQTRLRALRDRAESRDSDGDAGLNDAPGGDR